eukprot:m.184827 g.184827  ORF g.184827 m.184827 type:complete len:71 (-) comp24710_c0_seq3:608-820(-)
MYYIVYDGKEANPNDQQQDQTRWKDDMKQYFKEYQSQDFTSLGGRPDQHTRSVRSPGRGWHRHRPPRDFA